jgi:Kinase/pyrophosphorylase
VGRGGSDVQEADPVRCVWEEMGIDVRKPENSLHHLFTFPYQDSSVNDGMRRWSDFMECIYRGTVDTLRTKVPGLEIVRLSLDELKNRVLDHNDESSAEYDSIFTSDSNFALRLFFQRQADLQAQRRLLKEYSSSDLEHYWPRNSQQKIVFLNEQGDKRRKAIEFSLATDDGMSPHKIFEADIVLLGVSRSGEFQYDNHLSTSACRY